MVSLAGMDLGYGSQVQFVRTNILYAATVSAGTAQQHANYLQIFNDALNANQTGGGKHPLTCDYIVATQAPSSGTDPRVIGTALGTGTVVPLIGPSRESLAQQSALAAHQNSAADMGSTANGHILAIMSGGIVKLTVSGDAITTGAALATSIGTETSISQLLNSVLLAQTVDESVDGGVSSGNSLGSFITLGDIATDLLGADGTPALALGDADLTNPTFEGNASGSTPTGLSSVTGSATADAHHIVSIFAMVKAY
jgi:hypothetical protein